MNKCKLGELLEIKHGYAFKSENYVEKSQYALVTLANISGTNNFQFTKEKTTYYGAKFPEEFILKTGDLIMPLTEQVVGLFGNSAFVPEMENITFILNQRVGKVIPKNGKADIYYLHYLLSTNSVREQLEYRASGTRQRNISPKDIYDVDVFVPDYEEQKKIGSTLYKLEQRVNNNNKINRELEDMAKTLYDYWFLQFEFPNEEGKPYKSSGGKMVWNEELKREIPEGWEVENIFECMDVVYGVPLSTELFDVCKGTPVIRIRDIPNNTTSAFTTEEFDNKFLSKNKDLLIGMDGNFHMNFWATEGDCINQRIVRIRDKKEISALQIFYEIQPYIKAKEQNVARSTVGHLSDKDLKALYILNSYNENIYRTFDKLLSLICKNKKENQELTALRDFLLPLLMNGQVGFKEK